LPKLELAWTELTVVLNKSRPKIIAPFGEGSTGLALSWVLEEEGEEEPRPPSTSNEKQDALDVVCDGSPAGEATSKENNLGGCFPSMFMWRSCFRSLSNPEEPNYSKILPIE
jgi:hypothetical protein